MPAPRKSPSASATIVPVVLFFCRDSRVDMIQIHKENGWDDDAGQTIGWYCNLHYNYIA